MTTTLTRLPGGYRGYRAAVNRAYREPMHNPCVRWSLCRGFTAESALVPCDDDQFTIGRCDYSANTGEPYVPDTRSEYAIVRSMLLAFQRTLGATGSRDEAIDAAEYARFEAEID